MPHHICRIEIKNFRSCINADINLSPFTPLVGYNNAGKSNILSALQWLVRTAKLEKTDFNDAALPIEVIGYISGITNDFLDTMTPRQRAQIQPYIVDGNLKIRRLQRTVDASTSERALNVWDNNTNDWLPNPTGIDNAISVLLPEPIRIAAMDNATDDVSKSKASSTIGKLFNEFLTPVRDMHQAELNVHLNEIQKRISADGNERFDELNNIDDAINIKINDLFPDVSLKLDFKVPSFDDLIKAGTVRVYDEQGNGRDFSSYGHGAQRSIQMALIRHLADVRRAGATNATTLLLIDEPELYLHPFAIEQVRESLKLLSGNGYQIVFSTHSSQMITSNDAQHTLLIRKNHAQGTHSRVRLLDAIQVVVPDTVHQMEQLFSLSNSSQVLFSDKVVLTEGKTELRLMPYIFKKIKNKTFGQDKIALVPQSGVHDTKKSMDILRHMDLPTKSIADLDYAFTGAERNGFLVQNDPDVTALKGILARLQSQGRIILDSNGLPQKGHIAGVFISAAESFKIMAREADASQYIDNLHSKLLSQSVWLWKLGAIEQHLGLTSKNETAWAAFITNAEANGLAATCADYQSVESLVTWLSL